MPFLYPKRAPIFWRKNLSDRLLNTPAWDSLNFLTYIILWLTDLLLSLLLVILLSFFLVGCLLQLKLKSDCLRINCQEQYSPLKIKLESTFLFFIWHIHSSAGYLYIVISMAVRMCVSLGDSVCIIKHLVNLLVNFVHSGGFGNIYFIVQGTHLLDPGLPWDKGKKLVLQANLLKMWWKDRVMWAMQFVLHSPISCATFRYNREKSVITVAKKKKWLLTSLAFVHWGEGLKRCHFILCLRVSWLQWRSLVL